MGWGNSLAVRIPAVAEQVRLEKCAEIGGQSSKAAPSFSTARRATT